MIQLIDSLCEAKQCMENLKCKLHPYKLKLVQELNKDDKIEKYNEFISNNLLNEPVYYKLQR